MGPDSLDWRTIVGRLRFHDILLLGRLSLEQGHRFLTLSYRCACGDTRGRASNDDWDFSSIQLRSGKGCFGAEALLQVMIPCDAGQYTTISLGSRKTDFLIQFAVVSRVVDRLVSKATSIR